MARLRVLDHEPLQLATIALSERSRHLLYLGQQLSPLEFKSAQHQKVRRECSGMQGCSDESLSGWGDSLFESFRLTTA